MSKRFPHAKWVLPQTVHPKTSKCFTIQVPDEPYYLAAFRGALLNLASATQWADDPAHTAKDVALVWRNIYFNLVEACKPPLPRGYTEDLVMPIRIDCDCRVFALCCDGVTEVELATVGMVTAPPQPGGTSRPAPGASKCFDVVVQANSQWILPFAVNDGDIITISAVNGAWNDGTVTWYCPDGTPFVLGACVGSQHHDGGDPDATEFHMQVIAAVGSLFFPASGGTFTIPGGTGSQSLVLRANDGTLSDNTGSIALKICVESGSTPPVTTWCYDMDLTLSDYGFTQMPGGFGVWVSGTGLQSQTSGIDEVIYMHKLFSVSTVTVCQVTTCFDSSPTGSGAGATNVLRSGGVGVETFPSPAAVYAGCQTDGILTAHSSIDELVLNPSGILSSGRITITHIHWEGTGTNPFGTSNC